MNGKSFKNRPGKPMRKKVGKGEVLEGQGQFPVGWGDSTRIEGEDCLGTPPVLRNSFLYCFVWVVSYVLCALRYAMCVVCCVLCLACSALCVACCMLGIVRCVLSVV